MRPRFATVRIEFLQSDKVTLTPEDLSDYLAEVLGVPQSRRLDPDGGYWLTDVQVLTVDEAPF